MNTPIIAPPLAGNRLGSVGQDFVIAEWKDAGGPPGAPRWIAPLRLHRSDDEAWYMLEGKLHVRVGQEVVEANAGSAVFVPRRTAHAYGNAGPGLLRYLLVMTSNIWSPIQELHSTQDLSPAARRQIFENHDSEPLEG